MVGGDMSSKWLFGSSWGSVQHRTHQETMGVILTLVSSLNLYLLDVTYTVWDLEWTSLACRSSLIFQPSAGWHVCPGCL